ncbi:glutamate-5-semialdehyde dehydrogenase [Verrucomicrobia bacterium]|nr:glutamate-5-semialdehyde dehydrogenase [Verrucomicrobiota bacterium]
MNLTEEMKAMAERAKKAARVLATLSTEEKNTCLRAMADAIDANKSAIQQANAKDMEAALDMGLSPAMLDRLELTDQRVAGMSQGLREVANLPDPIGRIIEERTRPTGLHLKKVACPIGVIVIIYESRPNVTADAAGLCFKSGNVTILRGGKEAIHSNHIIGETMTKAAAAACHRFPEAAVQVVNTTDRAAIKEILSLTGLVDLCIPRGGEGLIRAVSECSRVPVIKHYKGICHVYVDQDACTDMATKIVQNAKLQRPGVCNALETLLIDAAIAEKFLPQVAKALTDEGAELRLDKASKALLKSFIGDLDKPELIKDATEQDWDEEYLEKILAIRVVDGVGGAIEHINRYGSLHSESIITANEPTAQRFLSEVDASVVYWNTSTRFTDGGMFGMGAEIGISTDKIGARGPMGLEELTTYKWIGTSNGLIVT